MRKTLPLFVFLLHLNFIQVKAQNYHKFLNNSSWCESENNGFGQPIIYYVYKQSNDTLIGSLTYSKIVVTGGSATLFVREDTTTKKVYKLNSSNIGETILYDFSLNIGDTLNPLGPRPKFTVTNIDTVTTLAGQRKRFTLNDSTGLDGYAVIEGIGCITAPFSSFIAGGDPVFDLVCSYQNNIQIYDGGLVGYTCYNYGNVPCNADFTYTPGPNGQVTFTNASPGYSSQWTFGYPDAIDTIVYTPSTTITLPCNASFTVQCQVSMNSSGTDMCISQNQLITIHNATNGLAANFTYTIEPNGQINFTNTSTGMGGSSNIYYEWDVYDTTNTLVNSSNSFSTGFTLPINHKYIVTLSDYSYPCYSSFSDTILNSVITTGIKTQSIDNAIYIYPNPNNGNFTIETNTTEKQAIQIFDVNGKIVLSQIINGKSSIDASILNEGIYNITVVSNGGIINKKLVIIR